MCTKYGRGFHSLPTRNPEVIHLCRSTVFHTVVFHSPSRSGRLWKADGFGRRSAGRKGGGMAQRVGTVPRRSMAGSNGEGEGAETPARTVRRRRGLPGSRAVVG